MEGKWEQQQLKKADTEDLFKGVTMGFRVKKGRKKRQDVGGVPG